MSLIKLSWDGREYLHYSTLRESLVSDIPAGDGKTSNLFLQCATVQPISAMMKTGWPSPTHRPGHSSIISTLDIIHIGLCVCRFLDRYGQTLCLKIVQFTVRVFLARFNLIYFLFFGINVPKKFLNISNAGFSVHKQKTMLYVYSLLIIECTMQIVQCTVQ